MKSIQFEALVGKTIASFEEKYHPTWPTEFIITFTDGAKVRGCGEVSDLKSSGGWGIDLQFKEVAS